MSAVISIVIPIYNERENLLALAEQVRQAMASQAYELILVDDGSSDGSQAVLLDLAAQWPEIRALRLMRNYGQSTALQAGFDAAKGEFIVTLDGDLQNDPADILPLVEMLKAMPDVDVVSGWRKERQDAALSRRLPSMIANRIISAVTRVKLHDYGCALKAYRAKIIHGLRLYGELHRFIPALAAEAGARIVEVPVRHRARVAGQSKYGIDRTLRVILDLLWIRFTMRFLHRPIHAFGGVALLFLFIGIGILVFLGFEKIVLGQDIGGRPLLMLGALLTLMGSQLLAVGLLGELLIRIYHEPEGRRQYRLKE